MLTRRGRVALSLAVVLLVAGRILGVTEMFGLCAAIVAVVALGVARVRAPQLRVALGARVVPPVIRVGELATLELSVENAGSAPTPSGRLQLIPAAGAEGPMIEVPRLVPGERATVSLRLPSDRRGRHDVSGFEAVLADALGTARRRVTGIGSSRYGVRPVAEPLSATLPSGGQRSELETTRSSAERLRSGTSLLRSYIAGDDLRRIHWPTTARVGDLMVREGGDRELDASSGVTVVLAPFVLAGNDPALQSARFEDAVRIAASLVTAARREGSFRLVVQGGADTGEGTGARHLDDALEVLTDVRAMPVGKLDQIRPALPWTSYDDRVVLFVAACDDPSDLPSVLGADPGRAAPGSAAVVVICAGGTESGIESVSRRHMLVRVPLGGSLEELWSTGESAAAVTS
ncbi:MAG: DUF58 domain-containing protein [Acidimicrobiales bacterium]